VSDRSHLGLRKLAPQRLSCHLLGCSYKQEEQPTAASQTLSASSSQILDVDYAEESSRMTRYQIMQQAGVAALGQAKAIPQSVVSLLS
jgi:flagellin-like hook-associated protein FlgL